MKFDNRRFTVAFPHSGETAEVFLAPLTRTAVDFLEHFGEPALVGADFYGIIGDGDGETRFLRLLEACGHAEDPEGFFDALLQSLQTAHSGQQQPVAMHGVVFPAIFLVAVLELLIPGERFVSVKSAEQLESLTNQPVPPEHKAPLQQVLETYPVRLSMHVIRQIRVAPDVAYQYLPFVQELDPVGLTNTWIGQFHQGLLEQMYQNRVIFVLNMSCPVYCRFCFRKHKACRHQPDPTVGEVKQAAAHIANSPRVKEMVLTGGDPFMNPKTLECAVEELLAIPHVKTLRLATRAVAYYPHLFNRKDRAWRSYLQQKTLEAEQLEKRMELATHFIHPDEVSPQSLDIISDLVRTGTPVYVQTPFLKDCNDQGPELSRLFSLLRGAGAEMHYIYIPCSPIQGNSVYWTPISKGVNVARYLRAHLSDRAMPRICTATPIGKMDWFTSGWAVEPDGDDEKFIWIRSPYTPEYFKYFAPLTNDLEMVRLNPEGTLDVRYMAQIGDPDLFLGARPTHPPKTVETDEKGLKELKALCLCDQREGFGLVSTGFDTLFRVHETQVELDFRAGAAELDYIATDSRIRDVVIAGEGDGIDHLSPISQIIARLQTIPHVNAVRLRSLHFNYAPERYSLGAIDRLAGLNRLTIANPLRLEIETRFLHADEIQPVHEKLAARLRRHGITVYNNTPLLGDINDGPEAINRLAYGCRAIGLEFHHLYVAGLGLQESWNRDHPVDIDDVLDIGTRVRREGSGREIPRYILRTALGEADFGLTARFVKTNERLCAKLLPYDLAYYQALDGGYVWPAGVTTDESGHPVVPVPQLRHGSDFLIGAE